MEHSDFVPKSSLYRLLGRLWAREVDGALLSILRRGDLADAYVATGGTRPPEGEDPEVLGALSLEYGRLFLGSTDPPPPYQSEWASGPTGDGAADSMDRYFKLLGYRPPWTDSTRHRVETGNARQQPMDHLGIQLDCFGHLVAALNRSFESPEPVRRELSDLASRFFRDHLRWPTPLFEVVARKARSEFYRSLINVTGDLLSTESASLEGLG